ncbi:MAG TPA: hypothetical protein PLX35_16155 [Cyclobacteriaceae bacterium]|nr:hypothetical protein [Cyclobacteriaceae bacterium]
MKKLLLSLLLCYAIHANGQHDVKPTSSFVVSGEIKTPLSVAIADLKNFRESVIGDVVITNHAGEKKSVAKGLKGVLLKDILAKVDFVHETPRELSTFYLVCKASDGYTVVYSWNELFNTAVGDGVFIITERDGQPASVLNDSVMMLSTADQKTGRRHVKALASIEIRRIR